MKVNRRVLFEGLESINGKMEILLMYSHKKKTWLKVALS